MLRSKRGCGRQTFQFLSWCARRVSHQLLSTPPWPIPSCLILINGKEAESINSPPRKSNTKSVSWKFVKHQINTCATSHDCGHAADGTTFPDDAWFPARLLDLGALDSDTPVRLIEFAHTRPEGPYLALSHCWGTTGCPTETLTTNFGDFLQQLPPLPPTFKDCLFVARKLGVRYVWIDSLCVVQDDRDDWARESALMHKVYNHGLCTVAAAASSDSNSGLFWERKQPPLSELRLRVGETILQVVDAHIVAAEVDHEVLQTVSPALPLTLTP